MTLDKNSKIFVAGHHGLVGSAIWNNLKQRGYNKSRWPHTQGAGPHRPACCKELLRSGAT